MKVNLRRLAAERKNKNLTQEQMADLMGMKNRQSYANKENGTSSIKSQELFEMIKIFGYTIDDIKLFIKEC